MNKVYCPDCKKWLFVTRVEVKATTEGKEDISISCPRCKEQKYFKVDKSSKL
jgi:RNase P subunit RPR2